MSKRVGGVSVGVVNGELPGTTSTSGAKTEDTAGNSSSSGGGSSTGISEGTAPVSGEKAGV